MRVTMDHESSSHRGPRMEPRQLVKLLLQHGGEARALNRPLEQGSSDVASMESIFVGLLVESW